MGSGTRVSWPVFGSKRQTRGRLSCVWSSLPAEQLLLRNRGLFRLHTVQTMLLDLNSIIREATLLGGTLLTESGVTLDLLLADDLPPVNGRSIGEAHRGQLWAERNPAGGATFCFSLPVPAVAGRSAVSTSLASSPAVNAGQA
jgi:hypothetical protein